MWLLHLAKDYRHRKTQSSFKTSEYKDVSTHEFSHPKLTHNYSSSCNMFHISKYYFEKHCWAELELKIIFAIINWINHSYWYQWWTFSKLLTMNIRFSFKIIYIVMHSNIVFVSRWYAKQNYWQKYFCACHICREGFLNKVVNEQNVEIPLTFFAGKSFPRINKSNWNRTLQMYFRVDKVFRK